MGDSQNLTAGDITPPPPTALQALWFTELFIGQVAVLIILAILILKKSTIRNIYSILNVLFISFLLGISYSILFYTGTFLDQIVPRDICVAASVLKHGFDPAFVSSIMLLMAESYFQVRTRITDSTWARSLRVIRLLRTHFPWVNVVIWVVVTALEYEINPNVVAIRAQDTFYCSPKHTKINVISAVETVLMCLVLAVFVVLAIVTIFRKWAEMRPILKHDAEDKDGAQDIRLLFHTSALSVIVIGILLLSEGPQSKSYAEATIVALQPLVVALCLGTQKSIISFENFGKGRFLGMRFTRRENRIEPFVPSPEEPSVPPPLPPKETEAYSRSNSLSNSGSPVETNRKTVEAETERASNLISVVDSSPIEEVDAGRVIVPLSQQPLTLPPSYNSLSTRYGEGRQWV